MARGDFFDPYAAQDDQSFDIGQDFAAEPAIPSFKPVGGPRPSYQRALLWPSIKEKALSGLHTFGSVASAPFRGVGTAIGVGAGALQGDPLKYARLPYSEQEQGLGEDIAGALGIGAPTIQTDTPFEIGRQGIEAAATELGGGVAPTPQQRRAFAASHPVMAGVEAGAEVAGELGSQMFLDPVLHGLGKLGAAAARGTTAERALASRLLPGEVGALSPEAINAAAEIAATGRRAGAGGRVLGAAFVPGMAIGAAEAVPATQEAIDEYGAWSPEAIKAAGHGLSSAIFAGLGLKHAAGPLRPRGTPEIADLMAGAETRNRRLAALEPRAALLEAQRRRENLDVLPEEMFQIGDEPFVAPPDWVSPEMERRAAAREILPEEAGIEIPEGGFAETFPEIGGRPGEAPVPREQGGDFPAFYDPIDDILSTDMTPRLRGTPRSAEIPPDLATLSPAAQRAAVDQGAIGEAPPSNVLPFPERPMPTKREMDISWPAEWRRETDPQKAGDMLGDYIMRLRTEGGFSDGQVMSILKDQQLDTAFAREALDRVSEHYGLETAKERLARRDVNVAEMRRQRDLDAIEKRQADNARRVAEETALAERLANPEQQALDLPPEQRGMDRRQAEVPVEQDRRAGDRRRVAAEVQLPEDHPAVERLVAAEEGRAQAEQVADTDAGTGLPGKRGWERILETVTPGDHVVAIDLSGFKPINDKIGHKAGDEVLNTVARVARKHFGDTAARYGGDEFGGLVRGGTREEALAKGEAFRAELAETRSQWKNEDTGEVVDIQPVDAHIGVGATQAEADAAANAAAAPKREARRLAAEQIEREQLRRDQARTEPGDSELDRQGIPPREPEPGSAAPAAATAGVEDRGGDVQRAARASRPAPAEVRAEQPAELAPPDLTSTAEYLRGLLPELDKPGYAIAPRLTKRTQREEMALTYGNDEKVRSGGVSRLVGMTGLEDLGLSPREIARIVRRGEKNPADETYRGLLERVHKNLEAHADEVAADRRRRNTGAEFDPEAFDAIEPLSPEEQAASDAEADKFAVRRKGDARDVWSMTREEFLGKPRITKDANARDLKPQMTKSAETAKSEPFGDGMEIRRGQTYVVLDNGKPVANYDGNTLVVDKAYRGRGLATDLVYDFRTKNPEVAPAPERTRAAQHIQEKVWDRIQADKLGERFAVRRPAPGQKGLPGIGEDVEAERPKEKAPEQRSMFGGSLMQGVEKKVPEGREASGPLFQQEQARQAKEEAGRQEQIPEPEPTPQPVASAPVKVDSVESLLSFARGIHGETAPTADQLRDAHRTFNENRETILKELGSKTKEELARFASPFMRNEKKDRLVQSAFEGLQEVFSLNKPLSFQITGDYRAAREGALGKIVAGLTDQDIVEYRGKVAESRAERAKMIEGVKNPQTLEDFERAIKVRKGDWMTPEQRDRYDALLTGAGRAKREADVQRSAIVKKVDTGATGMTLVETKHTRDGHDLFVVRMDERVDSDTYRDLNTAAKKLGGYYSSFKGQGAVPGFQFRTREAADRFMSVRSGDVDASEQVQARGAARVESAADTLQERAETLGAKAEESLNRERKDNTARRAAMAGAAEARARAEAQTAETMGNIAEAVKRGEAPLLAGLRHRTQVDALEKLLREAKRHALKDQDLNWDKVEEMPIERDHIRSAKLPDLSEPIDIFRSQMNDLASVPGNGAVVKALAKIARLAGDKERVTLSEGQADVVVRRMDKAGKYGHWFLKEQLATRKRLRDIGINNDSELREALRQFYDVRGAQRQENKLKAMERSLQGQNVGIDFFPTPPDVVQRLIAEADIKPGQKVLEPSAGKGDIADALKEAGADVEAVEVSHALRNLLTEKGHKVVGQDFNEFEGNGYDRIVMNPPFGERQDAAHVQRAYDMLAPGGRLVAVTGEGIHFGSDAKAKGFRDWLESVGGTSEKLPEGAFKSSFRPTGVNTRMVVIDKPEGSTPKFATTEKAPTDYAEKEKFYGLVPEVTRITADEMKPLSQAEINTAESQMKRSGKTPREWAESVDLTEPVKASIYSDGEIKVQDGHHRYLAAKILGVPLNVELQAINTKGGILADAVARINEKTAAAEPTAFKAGETGRAKKPLTVDMVKAAIPGLEFSEQDGAFVAPLKNGGELRVTPVGEIEVSPRARQALEASAKAAGEEGVPSPVGQYQRFGKDSLIKVAEGFPDGTVDHEGFHFFFEQALSEGERAAVLKRYGGEEEAAYAYADWAKSRKYGNSWFSKIMRFAQRIVHAFRPTWESTFEEAASGRLGGRVSGDTKKPASQQERFATAAAKPPVQAEIPGAEKIAKPGKAPTTFDKWLEFWRAGLVSAPGTHVANVLGNAGDVVFRLGETATSAALDPLLGGRRTRLKGEARAEFGGALKGASAGLGQLGKTLREIATLEPEKVDLTRPEEYRQGAIEGAKGRAVRIPFRLLGALDDYFKVVGGSAELHKLAFREAGGNLSKAQKLIENPTPAMKAAVESSKLKRTFQDPNAFAKTIVDARREHKWLNVVVPFAQTPANLARAAWERSPAGFGGGWKALQKYREAVKTGAPKEEVATLKGEALDALAKPMLGTLLMGTFAGVAQAGAMTGSGPTDIKERNLLRETGWQPYSFAFDLDGKKTYIPFNRFEPVSTLLGFAADMTEAKDSKTAGDLFDKGLGSLAQNFTSKTYLQGLADAAELINDPKRFGGQWVSSFAGSQVPNVVTKVAQAIDPVMRETNVGEPGVAGAAKRVARTVASRVPFVSESLNARRSATGEEIQRPGNAVSRLLSPVQPSQEKPGADLERLMVDVGYVPSGPAREATVRGKKVRFSDEEFSLLKDADEKAAEILRGYVRRGTFNRLPKTIEEGGARSQAGVMRDVYNKERDRARQRVYRSSAFRQRVREL